MWQEGGDTPCRDNTAVDTKGDEIQKLSVISTLPKLLETDAQSCITRVLPKMQQTLSTGSTEFHMVASSTFKTILEQNLVSHTTFTQTFLQSTLSSLESRDPVVAHAWLETLLDVIELLPAEIIRQEILPVAINKGQLSQPTNSRIICCRLLGKICTRFDSVSIKKEVLPTVHSLCQDVTSDVRACICLQLKFVAEGLGSESVKPALLPSIVELASDEESCVRYASVQTIVDLLPQLQQDTIKNTIAPLIKKLCENSLKADDNVVCIIAQDFGKLVLGLEKCLTPAEKTWFIKYFQKLAQMGIPSMKKKNTKQEFPFISTNPIVNERYVECRRQCAYNIPAMFMFVSSNPDDIDALLPTLNDLAGDPYYMVRRTVACGIHEVTKVLGPKGGLIKGDFIKLLKDDSEEVLQGLIPNISMTLELLVQSQTIGTDKSDSTSLELGRPLLKCESEVSSINNWRLSATMFDQLEILPKCFPSDFIYTYFVPMALNRALHARPIPVRLAAGRTLLVYLRYNLKATQRSEITNRLYADFACSANSYVRMMFVRIMIEAMSVFSAIYFKEHFYSTLLNLTEDPIANIRLKVVTLLPIMKNQLRLPNDKKLLIALEASIRNLMNNENDRDVKNTLTTVAEKLNSIEVKHEGQTVSTKPSKVELEDTKKFEEEKRIAAMGKASGGQNISSSAKKNPPKYGPTARQNSTDGNRTGGGNKQNIQALIQSSPSKSSSQSLMKGRPLNRADSQTKSSSVKQPSTSPSRQITDTSKASSMPEIPVNLLDDEFLVDTGIRIPSSLSSENTSTSTSASKIPNLQDIVNRRINNTMDRNRRRVNNFDKGNKLIKRHSMEYEDCIRQRSNHPNLIRSSAIDYEDGIRQRMTDNNPGDMMRAKRFSTPQHHKLFHCFESKSEEKTKRNSLIFDKDNKSIGNKWTVDVNRGMRNTTTSYSSNSTTSSSSSSSAPLSSSNSEKDNRKFKRHSLGIQMNYEKIDRSNSRTLRRYSTLDVNHNQGLSKIPLRNIITSGSRTAPSTRASSPIRSLLHFNCDSDNLKGSSTTNTERHLNRFSSSDEEVDKLCQKFSHCQTASSSRAQSPRNRDNSRLPIRLQRK